MPAVHGQMAPRAARTAPRRHTQTFTRTTARRPAEHAPQTQRSRCQPAIMYSAPRSCSACPLHAAAPPQPTLHAPGRPRATLAWPAQAPTACSNGEAQRAMPPWQRGRRLNRARPATAAARGTSKQQGQKLRRAPLCCVHRVLLVSPHNAKETHHRVPPGVYVGEPECQGEAHTPPRLRLQALRTHARHTHRNAQSPRPGRAGRARPNAARKHTARRQRSTSHATAGSSTGGGGGIVQGMGGGNGARGGSIIGGAAGNKKRERRGVLRGRRAVRLGCGWRAVGVRLRWG